MQHRCHLQRRGTGASGRCSCRFQGNSTARSLVARSATNGRATLAVSQTRPSTTLSASAPVHWSQQCPACQKLKRRGVLLSYVSACSESSETLKFAHCSYFLLSGCAQSEKKRNISRVASGPLGSTYEPSSLPPDHAWAAPWTTQCSAMTRPAWSR